MSEVRRPESVSVKRRRLQERQQQDVVVNERIHEQKRKVSVYANVTNDINGTHGNDTEDDDLYAERFDRESSVETPSERSVLTPDEPQEHRATFGRPLTYEADVLPPLKIEIPEDEEVLQIELDENRVIIPPSPGPVLQASLASWADFRYDRYSVVLDSPLSETLSPELETDETFSPIETATPVSFQQPKSRPSLISIGSVSQCSKRRTKSIQSPLSQTAPRVSERPAKRQSTSSTQSAFPAAEATLFEVPDLPVNALELIANASHESLPLTTLSSREPPSKSLRKSSVPRLSTALSHARMSSIKNFIKTPTSTTFPRPSSHMSRPSTSSMSGAEAFPLKNTSFFSNPRNSVTIRRPSTAMSTSSSTSPTNMAMTALPSLPSPTGGDDEVDSDTGSANDRIMQRKKSFSVLRRRSESIGQALKGLSKINTKHDGSLLAGRLPTPRNPRKSFAMELSGFPTPSLPPLPGKSIAGAGLFSSNPLGSHSGGNIGLGLRSVDGLSHG